MGKRIKYEIGQLINGLEYINDVESKHNRKALFKCYCGNEFITEIWMVKGGNTKSCGCLFKKVQQHTNKVEKRKHGDAIKGTKHYYLYTTWYAMKKRCSPNFKQAKNYYDKGIKVYDKGIKVYDNWSDYLTFKKYVLENLGERPKGKYDLHRIDNDKGYQPNNIVWIEKSEHLKLHRG